MVFSLSALWWRSIRNLWKLPDGRDWLWGKLGLVLLGGAMLSKSLIQVSVDGWSYVPSLLFDLKANYGGGNEDNGNLLQKVSWIHCYTRCPQPCSRPLLTHTSARDSWTLTVKSGSVSCEVTDPFSWVLACTRFSLCPPKVCFPVLCKFCWLYGGLIATSSKRTYATPRSAALRAPASAAVCCWPVPPQETLRHSSVSVSVGSLGLGSHKICFSPLSISGWYGVQF